MVIAIVSITALLALCMGMSKMYGCLKCDAYSMSAALRAAIEEYSNCAGLEDAHVLYERANHELLAGDWIEAYETAALGLQKLQGKEAALSISANTRLSVRHIVLTWLFQRT